MVLTNRIPSPHFRVPYDTKEVYEQFTSMMPKERGVLHCYARSILLYVDMCHLAGSLYSLTTQQLFAEHNKLEIYGVKQSLGRLTASAEDSRLLASPPGCSRRLPAPSKFLKSAIHIQIFHADLSHPLSEGGEPPPPCREQSSVGRKIEMRHQWYE